uniref:Ring finger protein 183 n=1 Tax=Callorhinchus milii TaxID=7868 RepID=A0A4W3J1V6_CALMI
MSEDKFHDLECTICFSDYNNGFRVPKVLECKHTFCLECLARMSLAFVSESAPEVSCPLCRQLTVLGPGRQITGLPANADILRHLQLEPFNVLLDRGRLVYKGSRKAHFLLHRPTVYTLSLDVERQRDLSLSPGGGDGAPGRRFLRKCCQSVHLRALTYVLISVFGISIFLIVSLFWTKQILWGMG